MPKKAVRPQALNQNQSFRILGQELSLVWESARQKEAAEKATAAAVRSPWHGLRAAAEAGAPAAA
eukprot:1531576-Pyramimonas_sp.AAC.1